MSGFIFILECLFVVFLFAVYFRFSSERCKAGTLNIAGEQLDYKLGNNLPWLDSGKRMNGIEVVLPQILPQIFIDAHANDRRHDQYLLFDPSQRLSLEGDFDTYFQVFVPVNFQVLALTILTPDFMLALMNASEKYDVEIKYNNLRIFANTRVFGKSEVENELLSVAEVLLKELQHKLKSWNPQQIKGLDATLVIKSEGVVKFGKQHYYSVEGLTIGAMTLVFAVPAWLLAGGYFFNHQIGNGLKGVFVGLLFYPITYKALRVYFRYRRGE